VIWPTAISRKITSSKQTITTCCVSRWRHGRFLGVAVVIIKGEVSSGSCCCGSSIVGWAAMVRQTGRELFTFPIAVGNNEQ